MSSGDTKAVSSEFFYFFIFFVCTESERSDIALPRRHRAVQVPPPLPAKSVTTT